MTSADFHGDIYVATPCTAPGTLCRNMRHDHWVANGEPAPDGGMLCEDCRAPLHYDSGCEDYRHDSPDAPACFLVRESSPRPVGEVSA